MNISEARKIGIAEGELIQKRTEVEVQVLRAGVGQCPAIKIMRRGVIRMLSVQKVTKQYAKTVANQDVSFRVEAGKIGILLGPNGAGKSTVVKCIAGLLRFQGLISICGYPNKSMEAKRLLGYIPEMPAMYDLLTVREHLEFMARAYRIDRWEEKADRLLERFQLDDKQKKLGRELSKGMQQKVSICSALITDPKVVLFDEPFVGLDPHAIKELKDSLRELRDNGACVLISTHMLDSVEELWDVANIMMDGKIAAVRSRQETEAKKEDLEGLFFSITEGASAKDKEETE